MEARLDLERLLKLALARGGDFAEVFIEHSFATAIVAEQRRIEQFVITEEWGLGLRLVCGDTAHYAYTNDPDRVFDLPESLTAALKSPVPGSVINMETRRGAHPSGPCGDFPSPEERIALVKRAEAAAWGRDEDVQQVKVIYRDSCRHITVANSAGFLARDERPGTLLAVQGVVSRNDRLETGYEPVGGTCGFELFNDKSPEQVAAAAIDRALLMVDARPAPGGPMPVVLAARAGGTMVHEAIGHGLEADLAGSGLSVYAGRMGEQVASPAITVIDDATLAGARGSLTFDDEGTPGERTVLVQDGILKGYLSDLLTARRYDLPLTGNGRRTSFRHRPIPRMTNTLIAPGKSSPEEILRSVPEGLLVNKMGGGQVNTVTGDFVFEVSEGWLIKNGAPAEPVRGATLIGNGPEVLGTISAVGDDLGFALGTCGKDGQGVPVADAQPTLLIPEITVGGSLDHA